MTENRIMRTDPCDLDRYTVADSPTKTSVPAEHGFCNQCGRWMPTWQEPKIDGKYAVFVNQPGGRFRICGVSSREQAERAAAELQALHGDALGWKYESVQEPPVVAEGT